MKLSLLFALTLLAVVQVAPLPQVSTAGNVSTTSPDALPPKKPKEPERPSFPSPPSVTPPTCLQTIYVDSKEPIDGTNYRQYTNASERCTYNFVNRADPSTWLGRIQVGVPRTSPPTPPARLPGDIYTRHCMTDIFVNSISPINETNYHLYANLSRPCTYMFRSRANQSFEVHVDSAYVPLAPVPDPATNGTTTSLSTSTTLSSAIVQPSPSPAPTLSSAIVMPSPAPFPVPPPSTPKSALARWLTEMYRRITGK